MKTNAKKILCLLLACVLMLSMAACGKKDETPETVTTEVAESMIHADVQEYMTTSVDDTAEILSLMQVQEDSGDTEKTVTCVITYAGEAGDGTATFTMSYVLDDGDWVLDDMDADLNSTADADDTEKVQDEESEKTEEKTETQQGSISTSSVEGSKILKGYSLKKLGTFQDRDDLYTYSSDALMVEVDGTFSRIVYRDGTVSADSYCKIEKLGDGYLSVTDSAEEINSTGVVTVDGEVLIPCEAAYVEWIDSNNGTQTGRYLKVVYSTGVTTDESEAYFYVTDRMLSLSAEEGDVLHTGYAKIYDVVKKRFVGDIQSSVTGYNIFNECGDCFTVKDEDDIVYLYNADGELIKQTSRCQSVGNGYMICYDSGTYEVYDTTGSLRFSTSDYLSGLDSTSGFLKKSVNSNYVLLDIDGNEILSDPYKSISSEAYGIVEVQSVMGEYQAVTLDGQILASTTEYLYRMVPGYYYYSENGVYALVGPEGIIAEGLDSAPYNLAVANDKTLMVLNDKEYSLQLDTKSFNEPANGLITVESDATGKYGMFDLFTGKQLLEYQYAQIVVVNDAVYARQGEEWTAFELVSEYR